MSGYLLLFFSAFLAATLLPFSSEALLLAMAVSDDYAMIWLFVAATTGNVLGALVNWALGRFCLRWQGRKWFPIGPVEMARASRWYNRFGLWSLLFAWVPIIGDPLTFVAGTLRARFLPVVVLVTIGKAGRYLVLLGLLG